MGFNIANNEIETLDRVEVPVSSYIVPRGISDAERL